MTRRRVSGPELAGVVLVVVVQAAVCWHFASRSYFVADDFPVFYDAQVRGAFDLGFLGSEVIVHFSPGFRLVSLLVQRYATFDWNVAMGFVLACHAVSVVLLQRILRLWAAPAAFPWWTLLVAFAYGISIVFASAFQWFSLGLQTIPPVTLGLATVHAYLCWRLTRRKAWLAWSAIALAGALAFYEKAVLIPVHIVLLDLLLLDPDRPLRESARRVVREWRTWAVYAGVVVAYLAVYATREHSESWHPAAAGDTLEYLRIAWTDGFVPALLGIRVTPGSGSLTHTWAVAACQLALVGAVALSVARRRSAWRAWAFLLVVFLLNALIVLPRVEEIGPEVGYALRYDVEIAALALIGIATAFSHPPGREAGVLVSWRRLAPVALASLALAAYLALTLTAAADIQREWPGSESRQWTDRIRRELAALKRAGVEPVLLDDQVPARVLPFWIRPGSNRLSHTLPLFLHGLRFDQVSDETYRVTREGHVRPVTFRPAAGGGALELARSGRLTVTGARAGERAGSLCVSAPRRFATVELRPPRVLRGPRWYLHADYTTATASGFFVRVNRGVPYGYPDRGLPGRPRGGAAVVELGELPNATPTFGGVRIDMPPGTGACFKSLVVGSYVAS